MAADEFGPPEPVDDFGIAEPVGSGGQPKVDRVQSAPKQPGLPDLGALNAIRTQLLSGMAKKGSDEALGAMFAQRFGNLMPGAHLRMPDGSVVPIASKDDMYRAGRDFIRQEQGAAEQHWPKLGFAAEMGGEVLSDYALGGAKAVGRTYQTLAGLARGLLGSKAELTPGHMTAGDAASAGLSTALGGTIGNLAPVLVGRIANSEAAQYLGGKAEEIAGYAGDKIKNLAGWLKVNSLHPTPLVGERMAALPGGTAAVGRELLDRGVGAMTKGGTAQMAATAKNEAGAALDGLVAAYDSTGGAPIDFDAAIAKGLAVAKDMIDQPTTKVAGKRVAAMIREYENKFAGGPVSASEALEAKRAIAKAVYGAEQELKKTGKTLKGDFGKGLSQFERAIDEQLDASVGAAFEAANLTFRRLLGASQAATRTAARQQTNLLGLGLQNLGGAGVGASLAGGPGAVAGIIGTTFARKYGAQAGARTLYGLGNLAERAPSLFELLSERAASGSGPHSAAMTLGELLGPVRKLPAPASYAMDEER